MAVAVGEGTGVGVRVAVAVGGRVAVGMNVRVTVGGADETLEICDGMQAALPANNPMSTPNRPKRIRWRDKAVNIRLQDTVPA